MVSYIKKISKGSNQTIPANLENDTVAHKLEGVAYVPKPKKGDLIVCVNYCTVLLLSHASKIIFKINRHRSEPNTEMELPDV